MLTRPLIAATAVAFAAATLAGCASDPATSDAPLTVTDPWVKTAVPEDMMSAAFGTLTNTSDADITVVGAVSDASPMIELHEVVDGTMQQKDGGFTVPAGESLTLQPGGLHLMLMSLPAAIEAGDQVSFTLELEDGSTVDFTATAKDFDGGNEDYDGGEGMTMESPSAEHSG